MGELIIDNGAVSVGAPSIVAGDVSIARASKFETPLTVGGYDDDPNDPGAPDQLKDAIVGTWYLRETPTNTIYRKLTAAATGWLQTLPDVPGITGPVSSTTDAVPRWGDEVGGSLLDSGVTVDDSDNLVVPAAGSVSHPGLGASSQSFGAGASVSSHTFATALGAGASVIGGSGTSIGASANVGSSSVGIGRSVSATSLNSVAVGSSCSVVQDGVTVGSLADVSGASSVAVGRGADVSATGGAAVGRDASVSATNGVAFGRAATVAAAHTNAVVLGRSAASKAADRCTVGTIGGSFDLELQCGKGFAVWAATPLASQPSKISDPTGGATIDTEARAAINAIIDVLEGTGQTASV